MKREIICLECARKIRAKYPTDTPYPGENIKLVKGRAKHCDFICDHCGTEIGFRKKCFAFSTWTNKSPYRPWEAIFLEI